MLAHMSRPERIEPGPGQESVWDYPRPPRIEPSASRFSVEVGGVTIAESTRVLRVLETSQPPAIYFPPDDVRTDLLEPTTTRTWCEWKGAASYWALRLGDRVLADVAWSYPDPVPAFAPIRGYLAFYPQRVDACFVDGEQASANEGAFYGGWVWSRIVGPFKGGAGSAGW